MGANPAPLIRFWRAGIRLPRQKMLTRGGVGGSEQLVALLLVRTATASIVPTAPLREAVAESCVVGALGPP
jgi:hypothetical protein